MAGFELKLEPQGGAEDQEVLSLGTTSVISFSGPGHKGRLLLDFEPKAAIETAKLVTGEMYQSVKEPMVLASISEINNIIAGSATTAINNSYNTGIRLAPPFIFCGSNVIVSMPKVKSLTAEGVTPYGKVRLNIAFEGRL